MQQINYGTLEVNIVQKKHRREIISKKSVELVFTGNTISEITNLKTWESLEKRIRNILKIKEGVQIRLIKVGEYKKLSKTTYDASTNNNKNNN